MGWCVEFSTIFRLGSTRQMTSFASKKNQARVAHDGVRLSSLSPEKRSSSNQGEPWGRPHVVAELATVFAYREIPDEVLTGNDLDLSIWSVVANDTCLAKLSRCSAISGLASPLRLQLQLSDLLPSAVMATSALATNDASVITLPKQQTVIRINLSGADQITDKAAHIIAATCPELKHLNLERALKLTDSGILHIVSRCRRLETLNLSYVTALQSPAMSCIGELRLPLRSLALAGCNRIPDYSLLRVFQACTTLETLDLSFCASVTDNVLLSLGKNCCKLRQLKLRGCRQISDTGVVALANSGGVNSLTLLDLTRYDLQYKFNDISLMALADNCLVLQTLILSGCAMVSDVGMDWLGSGCHALTYLDVSGCAALTDLSVRAISENMLQLRHLSIRHCVRVTDQGIRRLSLGCPDLTFLNAEGLPLLSDLHTSNTNGEVYRQGIAALAAGCRQLHHLDLSNCSSISDGTLHCIARLSHELTSLLLSGCYRVTTAGVKEVLTQCSKLTTLHVSGCDQVTDRAFNKRRQANSPFGNESNELRDLRLRGTQVSDVALKWLSRHSPQLRELDVSDCSGITDMGLLALTGSALLRSLRLRNVADITETGVSWLAEKCSKLMLLDVTGCPKVRSFSVKSLASSWKFAVYTCNDQFKGVTPLHRADDWMFIEEYGSCWRAAIQIQCLYRARVARRIARQKREERLILWVATRLQSVFRGRQARRYAVILRIQFYKEAEAATKIQRSYRQLLARREAERLREIRHHEEVLCAAKTIQASWRKKRLRERLQGRHLRRLAYEDKVRRSAIRIQRHWRGKKGRERTNLLRAAKLAKEREEFEAARLLQSVYRLRAARRAAKLEREEQENEEIRREKAARILQVNIRRYVARKKLRARVAKINGAATRIQQGWRAKKKYEANQILLMVQRKKRENDAAVKLLVAWKRRKARIEVNLMRLAVELQQQKLVDAALMVQTNWRGRHCRLEAHEMKQMAVEKVTQLLKVQNYAVTLVQAHYRGRRGRERYREEQLNKKKRWKEIVRPENGEKFYYVNCLNPWQNRVTGEVRFRRPQDVLDLLPKPHCENCEPPNEAAMECKDCGEMFCNACWKNVHSGGRRKLHEFRALYDYYNRRVDYGDWEFPSRWPSEIEQDEMDGWGYRILPRRQPDEVQGTWERYVDPDTKREWFYNIETEENSYIAPEGFFQQSSTTEPEWIKYYDETQSVHYYYNVKTQESTFDRPATYATPRISPLTTATTTQDDWEKHIDPESGFPYFYNRLTMESVFARPMGFVTGRQEDATQLPGWAKYFDATSGSYYYFNAQTNDSRMERPDAFATPRVSTAENIAGLTEFYDPVTGKAYYFNAETTECRQASSAV
ncbi:F-box/LRR-repeat protein 4 [Phytophthora citrophthora]|uniref:F-box/LRR-repeat protein 4 n=1 Tax=Phytophthora citrophthora TaxID=4793 RepID=A0AAD9GVL8_9STRA|nr:F-box/LRR-repeat protein 4 [Phytophthora citrophthora]